MVVHMTWLVNALWFLDWTYHGSVEIFHGGTGTGDVNPIKVRKRGDKEAQKEEREWRGHEELSKKE